MGIVENLMAKHGAKHPELIPRLRELESLLAHPDMAHGNQDDRVNTVRGMRQKLEALSDDDREKALRKALKLEKDLESEEEESFVVLHTRRGAERVRELMSDLPPDQAQILAKVYMEGKSHSEAAAELDLPLGTVKSRVRLAIQKLQGLMEA